jgi:hypothetical protein
MTPEQLEQVKRDGGYLRTVVSRKVKLNRKDEGRCPFHNEKRASFGIFQGDDGHWRYKCQACGETGTVIDYRMKDEGLGLPEAMQAIERDHGFTASQPSRPKAKTNGSGNAPLEFQPMVPPPVGVPALAHDDPLFAGCTRYEYVTADGRTGSYQRRYEATDTERKRFNPLTYGTLIKNDVPVTGWHDKAPYTPRALYRLETLMTADPTTPLVIVEDEKACEAAERLFPDYIFTTWMNGAGSVDNNDWEPAKRFDTVILWPDADRPKDKPHGCFIATPKLRKLFPAAKLIDTAGLEKLVDGYDAADLEEAGCDDPEAWFRERLREAPPQPGIPGNQIDHDLVSALSVHAWVDRDVQPARRMLGDVIVQAVRMFLVGQTGIGKTLFAYAIAAALAAGKKFLHWECDGPVRVLIIDGEMSERLIKRRAEVLLDHEKAIPPGNLMIYSMQLAEEYARRFPQLGPPRPLNEDAGREWLLKFIALVRPDIVILDNVMSLITGKQTEEDAWSQTLPLVLAITALGIAQVWLDHTGWQTNRQYGSSTKAWFFDVVGMMLRPENLPLGARETCFDLSFEPPGGRARNRAPDNWDDFAPHRIRLTPEGWLSESLSRADAANRAEDRRLGKLNPETRKLLRIIQNLLAEGQGEEVSPQPEMAPVTALRRSLLRERCIREGWHHEQHIRTELEGELARDASLTDRGLDREGKSLTALEAKGVVCHDRRWVWLP